MTANGKKIAEGRLERTRHFAYTLPFAFTGKIQKVTIELKPEAATEKRRKPA